MSLFDQELSYCLLEMDLRPRSENGMGIGTSIGNFLGTLVGNKIAKGGIIKALVKLQEEIKNKYKLTHFDITHNNFNQDLHRSSVEFINTVNQSDGHPLTLFGIKTGKAFTDQSEPTYVVQIYAILTDLIDGYKSILEHYKEYPDAAAHSDVKSLTQNIQYVIKLKEVLDQVLAEKERIYKRQGRAGRGQPGSVQIDPNDPSNQAAQTGGSQIQVVPSGQVVSQGYPQGQQIRGMKYAKGPRRLGNTSPPRLGNSSPPQLGY